jgi:hypothetical protein
MPVIVPLLCFALLLLVFSWGTNDANRSRRWRASFVSAAVVWGFLLTASTELLSAFQLLAHQWILMFWLLASAGCLFCAVGIKHRNRPIGQMSHSPTLSLSGLVLLAGVGLIIAIVGIIALVAPPNGWDSMVYHMSRTAHWIQNRTVAHYPTHIYRQLNSAPWAEFAITQLEILSGTDRLANLVQWFAMLGSILAASLVAAYLGADSRGQLFAAVACSTIPMGIAQASGTQNDYVVAFWLISFVYYALLIAEKGISAVSVTLAGASLGLALLTKGTAYLFVPPLVVWSAFILFRGGRVQLARTLSLVPAIVLILNAPFWLRNLELFADPLGGTAVSETSS